MYTDIQTVRDISGLDDEENIPDRLVVQKIKFASGIFDSAIANKYTLPLSFHRKNTLTFEGDGTGSGTMAIVINGTTYNIAITTGLTAKEAADLFRDAAADSVDFLVDSVGLGDIVEIISKDCTGDFTIANAQVNITDAPETAGMKANIGVRTNSYPDLVESTVSEIAASLLLMDAYGAEAEDTPKDGNARMEKIQGVLAQIQGTSEDNPPLFLYDSICKMEFSQSGASIPAFSPNDTTENDSEDPTNSKARINKRF